MQHYVIRMRDTSYAVVGPFDSQADAAGWGARDQVRGGDDPRWQVLCLADPHTVTVLAPTPHAPASPDPSRDAAEAMNEATGLSACHTGNGADLVAALRARGWDIVPVEPAR